MARKDIKWDFGLDDDEGFGDWDFGGMGGGGSSGYGGYSGGGFGSFYTKPKRVDDGLAFRVVQDNRYRPPTSFEIQNSIDRLKIDLDKYEIAATQDMASYYAGSDLREEEDIIGEIRSSFEKEAKQLQDGKLDMSRSRLFRGGQVNKRDLSEADLEKEISKKIASSMSTAKAVEQIKDKNLYDRFLGTPLEKALQYLLTLKEVKKKQKGQGQGKLSDNPLGDEADMEAINDLLDQMDDADNDSDLKNFQQELEDKNQDGKHNSDQDFVGNMIKKLKRLEDNKMGKIVEVAKLLDSIVPAIKGQKLIPLHHGKKFKHRRVEGWHDLNEVEAVDMARFSNPITKNLFIKEMVNKEIKIDQRYGYLDRRQFVYIIVDGSGSMGCGDRIANANAVVFNRMLAVYKGLAQVWVSPFSDNLAKKIYKADKPQEAAPAFKAFQKEGYDGGGTNIGRSLQEAIVRMRAEMKSNTKLVEPEILIVTDEDSSSNNIAKSIYEGIKIHGISVVQHGNDNLKLLCESSGGVYCELKS